MSFFQILRKEEIESNSIHLSILFTYEVSKVSIIGQIVSKPLPKKKMLHLKTSKKKIIPTKNTK